MSAKIMDTKIDRVSNEFKSNKVTQLIEILLREEETLTKTDIRRIFNYGYRTLWKNGDDLFLKVQKKLRKEAKLTLIKYKGKTNGHKNKK